MSLSSFWYEKVIKSLLFLAEPEEAHRYACTLLKNTPASVIASSIRTLSGALPLSSSLSVEALGKTFVHPVGLAAGFDKDARYLPGLFALGFSHIEVGTVTPQEQQGNPKPRVFRVPNHQALINRLGFPSQGVREVSRNLDHFVKKPSYSKKIVGINIGKQKSTALEEAALDYAYCAKALQRYASYLAINVSSPNTLGLRALQNVDSLKHILEAVRGVLTESVPLLIKVSPDLKDNELDDIITFALDYKVDGIIATNTTVSKEGISEQDRTEGGLSGLPLRLFALNAVRRIAQRTRGALVIVAVGGISSADDVIASLKAGASLVQIYTSLVYQGPLQVYSLLKGLQRALNEEGVSSINDLIGTEYR
jgi:dihydroorotate dehydrogenase